PARGAVALCRRDDAPRPELVLSRGQLRVLATEEHRVPGLPVLRPASRRSVARRGTRAGTRLRRGRQCARPRVGPLDDARPALTIVRRLLVALRVPLALSMAVVLAAHVGSPDVFWSGRAGAYQIAVVVRPPQVVPGIAEILVRAPDAGVERVTVRPVYWRAGSRGAPSADEAKPVENAPGMYSGRLWLMAGGSYSVHVGVEGRAGQGIAVVPVAAVATGQLQLSGGLRVLLVIL